MLLVNIGFPLRLIKPKPPYLVWASMDAQKSPGSLIAILIRKVGDLKILICGD